MRYFVVLALAVGLVFFVGMPEKILANQDAGFQELLRMSGQGNPSAMTDLGEAYYYGRGVLKDPFKAKCWIQQAREYGQDQGDDHAVLRAERLWNDLELWQYSGECHLATPVQSGPARGDLFVEPVTGMTFVWIPGKCFSTLAGQGKKEKKGKTVCPKGFWMGQHEVTQGQWRRIMSGNPSRFKGQNLPVEQVTYKAVEEFIRRMNQTSDVRFSLPTQIQWEFACTDQGRRQPFPWGRENYRPQANCGGCDSGSTRGRTAPVGSYPPNSLGIFDMGGNVREWCRDTRNRSDRDRPVRGGSFVDNVKRSKCRSGDRFISSMKSYYLGFRLTAERID